VNTAVAASRGRAESDACTYQSLKECGNQYKRKCVKVTHGGVDSCECAIEGGDDVGSCWVETCRG
jgi:hypothetical protein